jgi:hypothetical protein
VVPFDSGNEAELWERALNFFQDLKEAPLAWQIMVKTCEKTRKMIGK